MHESTLNTTSNEGVFILSIHESGYYFLYLVNLKGDFKLLTINETLQDAPQASPLAYAYLEALIYQIYLEDQETRKCCLIEYHLRAA